MLYAWIDDGDRRFLASVEQSTPTESAVTRLIQGIYDHEPMQARRILRRRIYTSQTSLTEMCWGMVRVAAKRIECGANPDEHPLHEGHRRVDVAPLSLSRDLYGVVPDSLAGASPMDYARSLVAQIPQAEARYLSARRVAAVLVSPEGRLVSWAVNFNVQNKTLHAEVNLCQQARRLPRGSVIYTTLQPCKMCAGMIWNASEDPFSTKVFYAEEDPGPMARTSVLTPGSFERQRAVQSADELGRTLAWLRP